MLAVALNPVFQRLADILGGRPKLAATVLTLVNLAVVIGPATWLGMGAVDGISRSCRPNDGGRGAVPSPPQSIKDWPLVGPQLFDLWDQAIDQSSFAFARSGAVSQALRDDLAWICRQCRCGDGQVSAVRGVAGVLFPYGPQLVAAGRDFLSRIVPDQSEHFLDLAGTTIRAVAQGVIGVAIVQSLLAGIGFKLAGIASAGLLAFVVLLLSIVQIGGTIVILPVIIWIWTDKEFPIALLLTVFLVIVSVLDNILKPLVMGRGLTTPALVILIGVIGGTLVHGIIGLFIGPIILSVVWELTVAWIRTERAPQRGDVGYGPPRSLDLHQGVSSSPSVDGVILDNNR